jgi:hypothetical protein
VEAHSLTVWATDRQHLLSSKFTFLGFRIRKSSSPRFLLVGQALRGVLFWFVCIWFIFYYYYYYYLLFAKFIYCMFCKVLFFNTIVTACLFQLLLLNRYIKLSGYFGSFLAEYCVHRSTTPFTGSDCRSEEPSSHCMRLQIGVDRSLFCMQLERCRPQLILYATGERCRPHRRRYCDCRESRRPQPGLYTTGERTNRCLFCMRLERDVDRNLVCM